MVEEIRALQEESYGDFMAGLLPTVPRETIIGVRVPVLRQLAKRLWREQNEKCRAFMRKKAHTFLEEKHLHRLFIQQLPTFEEAIAETEAFLPLLDNWATCDSFTPPAFRKNPVQVLPFIEDWLGRRTEPYTQRLGLVLLLQLFTKEHFEIKHLDWVRHIASDQYYVNMAIAWYLSQVLANQYAIVLPYFEEPCFSAWIHNKAIQKAIESRQIPQAHKLYLRSLRIKKA